jgi:hypothetical protein
MHVSSAFSTASLLPILPSQLLPAPHLTHGDTCTVTSQLSADLPHIASTFQPPRSSLCCPHSPAARSRRADAPLAHRPCQGPPTKRIHSAWQHVTRHRHPRALEGLDDHAFKRAALLRMRLRTFSSFGNACTCACGHTVEDDDDVHTLGYDWLSGVVQSCHSNTAEVLPHLVSRLGFSSSCKGRYFQLASRTHNRPQARWEFYCNLRLGPSHGLTDVHLSLIHPLTASYLRTAAFTLATLPLSGTLTSAEAATRITHAPDVRSWQV